ncbi:MAG: histidine kinase [Bacteroidetes bacterium]|nr:histidine kinase [Bacteroidota bacterium]
MPALLVVLLGIAFSKPPQESLLTSAHRLENLITDAQGSFDKICNSDTVAERKKLTTSKIKVFVFTRKGALVMYNDNKIYPPFDPVLYQPDAMVSKMNNGWYLQLRRATIDGNIAIGYVLLKHEYRFENKFLKNEYDVGFKIPANYNISDADLKGSVQIRSREGKVLFSLYADDTHVDNDANVALVLVYFLILLILGYYLNEAATVLARTRGKVIGLIFLIAVSGSVRYWMAYLKFPSEFHKLDLFNPSLYGSNVLAGSLGDLLLTCVLVFWLTAFYFSLDDRFSLSVFSKRMRRIEQVFLISLQFVASGLIYWIFKSLVLDSVISFEVYNILSLDQYSLFGLICISLIIICHFLLSINAFRRLIDLGVTLPILIGVTVAGGAVFVLLVFDAQFWEAILFTAIWSLFFCLIGFRIFRNNADIRAPRNVLAFILLYSILSMFLIENCYEIKERNKRMFLAEKLLAGHDYVAEFTFDDIAQRISADKVVKNAYNHFQAGSPELHDRISSLYFSGYFSKYDLKVFAYDSFGVPIVARDTVPYTGMKALLDTSVVNKLKPDFVYINDSLTNSSYLGLIPISADYKLKGIIALYLTPKSYNGQNVYPELLLGQNITSTLDNSAYDFAIYQNDRMIVQHGDFPYSYYWDRKMNPPLNTPEFFETNAWEHLIARYSNNKSIIISIPQEGFFEPVATTSYFFILYSVIVLIILLGFNLFRLIRSNAAITEQINVSFRARINYSMLFIIIVSFAVIGSLTISFFKTQYDNYYTDRLVRKEKAILTSIEYFLQENEGKAEMDSTRDYDDLGDVLGIELVKIADIHNIDINVFDADGDLATSSQLSIFDNGLISTKMDPIAFKKMAHDHETQFTQQENIGGLKYTASYAPIRNKAGTTIAYLNVPYFEKSKTINDEVSSFLITLMNAYVFLLLCAAVMAYFISNSITRPLRFISEKLRILNLNKRNEPIEWKSRDEVGTLISEYNKMIAELENSAAKLAKSERESAWREMARQIAHEIKNPLTPMKLSIQYLQRAIDEGKDVTELAKRVNKTLIEQIDNLSAIATAFSTFAQMPKSQKEVFDLNDLLNGIVSLFAKEDNVRIHLTTHKTEAMIHADKNQMVSVFNNLIKNAIQSIPEGKKGDINVITMEENGKIKTIVMDNGSGIPKESYDKVFVPNFTTKSSGTGLGLAICKQIVESMGGEIWFESTPDEGTSFFVTMPYYKEEEDSKA